MFHSARPFARTTNRVRHEPNGRERDTKRTSRRVVTGESQFLAKKRSVVEASAQKHLNQRSRDARKRKFEKQQHHSFDGTRCYFARLTTKCLAQRVAPEQNDYDHRRADFHSNLVIVGHAACDTTKGQIFEELKVAHAECVHKGRCRLWIRCLTGALGDCGELRDDLNGRDNNVSRLYNSRSSY